MEGGGHGILLSRALCIYGTRGVFGAVDTYDDVNNAFHDIHLIRHEICETKCLIWTGRNLYVSVQSARFGLLVSAVRDGECLWKMDPLTMTAIWHEELL